MGIICALAVSLDGLAQSRQEVLFPRPFALAVDDMGWIQGGSQDLQNGPWRLGFKRVLTAQDYLPLVEIGKAVGIRIQGVFILCELDRENGCAQYPSTTRDGRNWDNSRNRSDQQIKIMETIKQNSAWLEFGLHGVGHEYWQDGVRRRAEWYNLEEKRPWRESEVRAHIECFKRIMAQYGLTSESGQSFPESFVPCAYGYYWNPAGQPYSLGKILRENGVKYVNSPLEAIRYQNPPANADGGFDNGVLVLDRQNFGNEWWEPATLPRQPVDAYRTDIIEAHWTNLLATDDLFQKGLNERWIKLFQSIQARPDRYLAKNTEQLYAQWLYKKYTRVAQERPGVVAIDNRKMSEEALSGGFAASLVLKIKLGEGKHISQAILDGLPIPAYMESQGYGFLYLPPLEKKAYRLSYHIGLSLPELTVLNQGTYNVYSRRVVDRGVVFTLRMYGTQEVLTTSVKAPSEVICSNPRLSIVRSQFQPDRQLIVTTLSANNIQGETGELRLLF